MRRMQEQVKKARVGRFVELMEQVSVEMRSRLPAASSDPELTMSQARTLLLLGHGHTRMTDISTYLGHGMSSASGMIDRLVKKGLVERAEDDTDRRVVVCGLTLLGREAVERFWRVGRMKFEALAEVLSVDELDKVLPAMVILSEATARLGVTEPIERSPSS